MKSMPYNPVQVASILRPAEAETRERPAKEDNSTPARERLVSLDALRGFAMFWLIGGGDVMRSLHTIDKNAVFNTLNIQFRHVEWNGFHLWDLIFPLFLFLIGVGMPFSYGKRSEKGATKKDLYLHTFFRAASLFILGLIYYGITDPHLERLGYYGVLQRLASGYFIATIIMLNTTLRGQALWAGALVAFHFIIMKFIPVPGYGAGVLTPEGNLDTYWQGLVTGLLGSKFAKLLSLSLIPTVSTAILGILAGQWMRGGRSPLEKVRGLSLAGAGLIAAGLILALAMPINKLLWSSSYVLFSGGLSCWLLASFYWIIDIKGRCKWAHFFVVIGLNPIVIYVLAHIINFRAIVKLFTQSFIHFFAPAELLVSALCLAGLHWLVVYWLHRNKIYIRL